MKHNWTVWRNREGLKKKPKKPFVIEIKKPFNGRYILDDAGEPISEPNLLVWGLWLENSRSQRIVGKTIIGKSKVSTVFLGLDYRWGDGPPILWETMIFGGKRDKNMERCSGTRADALKMHQRWVRKIKRSEARKSKNRSVFNPSHRDTRKRRARRV